MGADTTTRKIERDTVHHLARIATALERIADTLDKMHEADPVAAINAALAAEQVGPNQTQTTVSGHGTTDADPVNHTSRTPEYGADVPPDQKWRLGNG